VQEEKATYELAYEDYKKGLKYKEIAEKYGISLNTVKSWRTRHWVSIAEKSEDKKGAPESKKGVHTKTKKGAHKNGDRQPHEMIKKDGAQQKTNILKSLELSDKERVFAESYVRHKNKTLAAIQVGYPKNTAHVQGSRLYRNDKVFAYIQALINEIRGETIFDVNEMIEYHMKVAFADLGDYLSWGIEETGTKSINKIRFKDSGMIDTSIIAEVKQGKDGVSVKIADKKYSMQWLTDFFQLHPMDKHRIAYDNARLEIQRSKLEEEQETVNFTQAEHFFGFMAKLYRHKPVEFCQAVLNFEPDDWQKRVLNDLAKYPKVTVRSAQGVGKTGIEACVLLWFLACFPHPKIIASAPTRQQLHDVLWSEVSKWQNKSEDLKELLVWTKTRIYRIDDSERCFAVAKTATRPENMQGFHEDNMLFIVDEASGVADPIMEAILGTLSGENNKLLMCGNPTKKTGVFHDSHTVDKDLYKTHKISAFDSSRTNKENVNALVKKFGERSNVVRVRVHGEFPIDEDDVFISTALAESGLHTENRLEKIETIDIGVDVARFGDDSTVIATKVNNTVLPLAIRRGQDLMATANQTVVLAKELHEKHKKRVMVKIDDTGVGGGVSDRMIELKIQQNLSWLLIIPINLARSVRHAYYENFTTLLWGSLKELLEDGELCLPDDAELIGEITNRKKLFTSSGKIALERKDDMKKRGLPSPDRADAVTLATFFIDPDTNQRREGGDSTRR